ncbi:MAG: hypothetical protein GY804_02870 [Alphaproteobacteria bacterium]|nr:hypothetical protein [Alphaproteobacteria bacterium]
MKGKERKEYNKLPKRVEVFRAINDDAEKYTAISWTLSEDVAKNVFSLRGNYGNYK